MRLYLTQQNSDIIRMKSSGVLTPVLSLLFVVIVYNGCGKEESRGPSSIQEKPYCGTAISQTSAVTVSGSAGYYYRTPGPTGLSNVSGSTKPIRYTEFHVVDSSGNILQCGETDGSGNFSFQIKSSATPLTLEVISRGYNSYHKTSILNDPKNNAYYKITAAFTPNANISGLTVTASATGSLEGGAFNILDKILDTNNYLTTGTASCGSLSGTYKSQNFGCTPFTVDYKLRVYWIPGFNPNSYNGAPNSTSSFYLPSDDNLFICGGLNGDVNSSDTDHFDNSIVIHEYGHFLEAHYSKSDSPGGSHSGTKALDPRLVYSEGFANFLQAAVTGSPYYIDTSGNPSGTASVIFKVNLEDRSDASNYPGPSCFDCASTSGEGNFREFGISRALYDLIDTNSDGAWDPVTNNLGEFWAAFTALKTLDVHFRSVGLLYEVHKAITGATNWASVVGNEQQVENRSGYGTSIQGGGCTTTLASSYSISDANSTNWPTGGGLFNAFDFYDYVSSGGTIAFNLNYTPTGGGDLDLFIYRESYRLYDTTTLINFNNYAVGDGRDAGNFTVNAVLPAGHYLVVVQYYSGGGAHDYTLTANGVQICPAP